MSGNASAGLALGPACTACDSLNESLLEPPEGFDDSIPGLANVPTLHLSFFRRPALGSGRPAYPAVDPGRGHSRRHRARSLEYHRIRRAASRTYLEHGIRCGALALALFPVGRGDRSADLVLGAARQGAARAVGRRSKQRGRASARPVSLSYQLALLIR